METMRAEQGELRFQVKLRDEVWPILEERWSDKSPEEGTELCICSWCGKMIGRDRDDPMIDWDDHIEYCGGCELCEIAVRMWKTIPNTNYKPAQGPPESKEITLELRFHSACLNELSTSSV